MAAFFIVRDFNVRPVLPVAEMTGQQLFMSAINGTKLTLTILLNDIAVRDMSKKWLSPGAARLIR